MRRNRIAIVLFVCAFAVMAVAQDQPASAQNPAMPAQTQTVPDQTTPSAQTTAPTPQQSVAPAMPASDQTAVSQNAPADQSAVSQNLIQQERDSWAQAKAKNEKYFKQGLPSNVTATAPNGATEDKPTIDSMVRKYGIHDYSLSNFNVTFPSSDRAEITYNASFSGQHSGQETRQVTSEWQRNANGTWENVRVDFR